MSINLLSLLIINVITFLIPLIYKITNKNYSLLKHISDFVIVLIISILIYLNYTLVINLDLNIISWIYIIYQAIIQSIDEYIINRTNLTSKNNV